MDLDLNKYQRLCESDPHNRDKRRAYLAQIERVFGHVEFASVCEGGSPFHTDFLFVLGNGMLVKAGTYLGTEQALSVNLTSYHREFLHIYGLLKYRSDLAGFSLERSSRDVLEKEHPLELARLDSIWNRLQSESWLSDLGDFDMNYPSAWPFLTSDKQIQPLLRRLSHLFWLEPYKYSTS